MGSEWRERKRLHRRGLALGIGISVCVHAAVLAWTVFPAPTTEAVQRSGPDRVDAGTAFQVVRLVDANVSATPDVDDTDGAAGFPATLADARDVTGEGPAANTEADVEAVAVSTPTDPGLRARPVTAYRRTSDLRAQLEPPSLAIDLPRATTRNTSTAPARTASITPPEEAREGGSNPQGEDAGEAHGGETTPEDEGASDDQEDEGGWGLGDLFRGVAVAISGGGICPPGLVDGRPAPAVTSVNDRNPLGSPGSIGPGGSIRMPGPSDATDPAASIGRIGGVMSNGGIGGIGGTGRSGPVGRMAGIGGIRR